MVNLQQQLKLGRFLNQKIRNATVCKAKGITFKSKLEKTLFTILENEGFSPKYEPYKVILLDFEDSVTPFYDKETTSQHKKRTEELGKADAKKLRLVSNKMLPITYTPDIYFNYNNVDVWIEVKGMENDVFYLKKKLFRKYLDDKYKLTSKKSIFFEVYSKKQLMQAINIIKHYGENS